MSVVLDKTALKQQIMELLNNDNSSFFSICTYTKKIDSLSNLSAKQKNTLKILCLKYNNLDFYLGHRYRSSIDTSILVLYGLNGRTPYFLHKKGIHLGELLSMDSFQIMSIEGVGIKKANNIQTSLENYRLDHGLEEQKELEDRDIGLSSLLAHDLKFSTYEFLQSQNMSIDELLNMDYSDFSNIKGLGDAKIQNIITAINSFKKQDESIGETKLSFQFFELLGLPYNYYWYAKRKGLTIERLFESSLHELIDVFGKTRGKNFYNHISRLIFEGDFTFHSPKFLVRFLEENIGVQEVTLGYIKNIVKDTIYDESKLLEEVNLLVQDGHLQITSKGIKIVPEDLLVQIEQIAKDQRENQIMLERLQGKTLQEIGQKYDISRERVRQIAARILSELKNVEADKYKDFYKDYNFTCEEACEIFGISTQEHYYLEQTRNGYVPTTTIIDFMNEYPNFVDCFTKDEIYQSYGLFKLGDSYVLPTNQAILKYLYESYENQKYKSENIYKDFKEIANKIGLSYLGDSRSFEGLLERSEFFLSSNRKQYRPLEIRAFFNEHEDFLHKVLDEVDNNFSSLYFYNKYEKYMRESGILDEYELHALLKRFSSVNQIDVTFYRSPVLGRNYTKNELIINTIMDLSPILMSDFTHYLWEHFGHRQDSMSAKIVKDFIQYVAGDMLIYDIESIQIKTNILENLKDLVTYPVYSKYYIDRMLEKYQLSLQEKNYYMHQLGYRLRNSYFVEMTYTSVSDYIRSFYQLPGIFDASDLIDKMHSSTKYTILNSDREQGKLFHVGDNQYFSIPKLEEKFGCPGRYIKEKQAIMSEIQEATIYSIEKALKNPTINEVFKNSLVMEAGLEKNALAELIYDSNKISQIELHGNIFFRLKTKAFTVTDIILSVMRGKSMYLTELGRQIEEEFYVQFDLSQLHVYASKSSDRKELYYSPTLRKLFTNKEQYIEEVYK
jgi:hypothetical protein